MSLNDRLSDEQADKAVRGMWECLKRADFSGAMAIYWQSAGCLPQAKSPAAQGAVAWRLLDKNGEPVRWVDIWRSDIYTEEWMADPRTSNLVYTADEAEPEKAPHSWQPLSTHPTPAVERPAATTSKCTIGVNDGYAAAPAAPNATPRVDQAIKLWNEFRGPNGFEFARQLERELAAVVAPAKVGMPEEPEMPDWACDDWHGKWIPRECIDAYFILLTYAKDLRAHIAQGKGE